MSKAVKRILKVLAGIIIAILLVVVVYLAYVILSYDRLDDSLALPHDAPAAAGDASAIDVAGPLVDADADSLTVVSANLGFGAYNHDFDFFMDGGTGSVAESADVVREDVTGSAKAVRALDPDFILFQEVDIDGTRSHHIDQYALLREQFPESESVFCQNYDSAFLAWPPYAPHGANKAGLVTFSDCDIAQATRRSLPISESFSKFLDLDRCYSICRISSTNGHDLVLINVHLSAYGADADIMAAQREKLYEDMVREYEAGNYVIAGGDFNHDMIGVSDEVYDNEVQVEASWAKPYDFEGVPEGFTVAAKEKLDAVGEDAYTDAATCRDAGRPYDGTNDRWVMDTFIYSDNVECVEYGTVDLDFAYSDHNPVALTFKLKQA